MFSNFESSFALLSVSFSAKTNSYNQARKRKESLQLHLRNLNYLHQKVDAKCWLEEMTLDISDDVITLGACLHVFFNVCLHSRLFLLCADWQKSDSSVNREPEGNEAEFKFQRWNLSFLFLPRCQSVLESLPAGYYGLLNPLCQRNRISGLVRTKINQCIHAH